MYNKTKEGDMAEENIETKPMEQKQETSLTRTGWFLFIMLILFGGLGVHRFLVGKVGTGVLYIFTGGLFGIGLLVDFIMILCSSFTDKAGNRIKLAP